MSPINLPEHEQGDSSSLGLVTYSGALSRICETLAAIGDQIEAPDDLADGAAEYDKYCQDQLADDGDLVPVAAGPQMEPREHESPLSDDERVQGGV